MIDLVAMTDPPLGSRGLRPAHSTAMTELSCRHRYTGSGGAVERDEERMRDARHGPNGAARRSNVTVGMTVSVTQCGQGDYGPRRASSFEGAQP